MKRIVVLISLLNSYLAFSQVQYYELGSNPLSTLSQNLKILSTKNFEIVYGGEYEDLAKITAQYAEAAYFDLSLPKNWDYRLRTKARINVFSNFWEFQSYFTSFQPGLYKNGISFHHHANVGFAYFMGDRASFYAQIRYLICKFIIYDQLLGKSNLNFQHNLLLYLPDWFAEGAAYFMSEGWDENDEMLMKQIKTNQWEELLMRPSNAPTYKTVRKSFWFFIAKEWKKEKINEIFYMTRLTRSIEGGLLTVLGQTHRTIMARWIAFCESFKNYESSNTLNALIPLKKNQRILGWDANHQYIVGLIEQNTQVFPFVYEIISQNIKIYTSKKLKINLMPDFNTNLPVKINAKGTQFIYPDFDKKNKLLIFDIKTLQVQTLELDKPFDGFNQFYPLPNSDEYIISAYLQANSDLFLLKPSGKTENLTKTLLYDELFPIVYDENTIFYSCAFVDTSNKTYSLLGVQNAKSLVRLDINSRNYSIFLQASENDYIPIGFINQQLIFRYANTFPAQIMSISLENKNFKYLSNFNQGFLYGVIRDNYSYIALYEKHRLNVASISLNEDTSMNPKYSDRRIFSMVNQWNEELKQRKNQKQLDEVLQQDTTEIEEIQKEEDKKGKVKYYVFDEGDTVKITAKQKKKNKKKQHVKYDELFFTIERAKIEDIQNHGITPIITKVNVVFDIDPIYRLGVKNEIFLKDTRNQRDLRLMFTPFLKDFQSSYHQIEYQERFKKFQWNISFYKQSNHFKDPFWIRYNHATLNTGITRFLSYFDKIKLEVQTAKITRYDLRIIDNRSLNGSTWNNQLVLRYEYKKLKTHQNYIYQGNHLIFQNTSALYWREKNFHFTNFELDFKNYVALEHIVLASRFRGAFSLGRVRPNYFMGGWDQWLNAEFLNKRELPVGGSIERFYYSKIIPLKGFAYNARNGTQFLMATSELRIPSSRIVKRPSSGIPLYNFQWILFGEIGTVWTTGNPFSQRNPIDSKTIERPPLSITVQSLKSPFILSAGMGVKFHVIGYPIRLDVAFPIEDGTFTSTKFGLCLSYEF